ncbi:3' exoribonuclease family protein [Aspergillus saccharolyticus JOP 1030-1]|uniref:Ribosomal RNA-processing protein 43 n=1 Tax=Aspergillus saccharolyticus JOP 1030-1 TaxID=1450539 RepID=A0A319AF14_9EURO|nr:ribosomal protein S5 domain 2-like protein [Aspergillus saccharolyticus JOP 1030-1]PYH45392.1 ribosomal protein S5 domain 2-like protein [Aspergillus saccharolyticus JOP 1030-1]
MAAPPPALTLPPSQFARLQPHAYLLAHLSPPASSNQPSIRANGRASSQFRPTSANTGSLTHTNGSAVVRVGDTTAVCGVRAELLPTSDIASWSVSRSGAANNAQQRQTSSNSNSNDEIDPEESQIQDFNLLVPNLSLSTGCAPGFVPGAPPSALAQSLSHQILALLHSTRLVRADDLRVWYQVPRLGETDTKGQGQGEGGMDVDDDTTTHGQGKREIKAFWALYIDIMIVSLAGNPFDAAWAAVLAALRDTKLPRAWWDVDNEMVVCSDAVAEARRLALRGLPVASSFCVFEADAAAGWRAVIVPDAEEEREIEESARKGMLRRWVLADPDGYEEGLSQERVCVVVDKVDGKTVIVKLEKNGGWAVDGRELKQLVEIAADRWEAVKEILEQC